MILSKKNDVFILITYVNKFNNIILQWKFYMNDVFLHYNIFQTEIKHTSYTIIIIVLNNISHQLALFKNMLNSYVSIQANSVAIIQKWTLWQTGRSK